LILGVGRARANELWPELSRPPAAVGGGEHDAAVIVGVEKYAFVEPVLGAKQNADAWQAYLTETLKVQPERVALLRDEDATNDEIRQAAVDKAAQVEPGGTLWFVFIGHGAPSRDGKDGLLVGVDAQRKAESVYKRSLSRNELLGILAQGKQARTVVLLDACFSGKTPSGRDLVANLQPLVTMGALPQGLDDRTILLTAARSDQFAGPLPKAEKPRPAFSYLALGALRGWAADASGRVTALGIVEYAQKALGLAHDRAQTPELAAGAPGAVLGRGRERAPDLGRIDREGAASGGGFQVTSLPAVPQAEAPGALESAAAGALDFRSVDVEVLDKYNAAFELDKSAEASAEDKAAAWRRLAKDAPKFADMAGARAVQWESFAAQKKTADEARRRRIAARDADWQKLEHLLSLAVVPETDKSAWSSEFLGAYWKSPGVEPAMAKAMAAHLAAGQTRDALEALARKAATDAAVNLSTDANGLSKASVVVVTTRGAFRFKFYSNDAPNTVHRFIELIQKGFYNGLSFHRVIENFVVQGGDPLGTGAGGSGQRLKAEFNSRPHVAGTLAMARAADPDSADSQFYVTLSPQPQLDGQYTVFGQVIEGLDVLRLIREGDKMTRVAIE